MHKEKAQIVEAKIVNGKAVIPKGWGSFVGTGKKGKSGKVHKKGVVYAIKLQVGGTKGAKRKKSPCSKKATKKAPASKRSKTAKKSGTRRAAKKTSRKTSAWKNAPGGKMQYRTLASGHVEERAKPTKKGGKSRKSKKSGKGKGRKSKKTAEKGAKRERTPKERAADKRRSKAMKGTNPFGNAKKSSAKKAKKTGAKKSAGPRKSTKKELARDSRRRHAKGSRKPTRKQAARAYAKRKASASKSLGAKAEANRFKLMDAKMARADAESRAKGYALADRAAKWKAQMKKWKAGK